MDTIAKVIEEMRRDAAEQATVEEWADRLAALDGKVLAGPIWGGFSNGFWYAGSDWQDENHMRLHLSGFGDEDDKAKVNAHRVMLVEYTPPKETP